ncbi:MAG: nucleotidyltransferase family protein [Eubacteriales bacterium]
MKICGIIAEYNPFHNGHKLQMDNAKKQSSADICVVIMSGMFTQRGDMAIASKYERAKMALSQGADIVIELPVCYVLQPAEYFALGGVGILDGIGTDYISYGTEAISEKDRKIIDQFVNITNNPTRKFEKHIQSNIKDGLGYPQARALAFQQISSEDNTSILKSPNAILEIAYRNAIYKLKSKIQPIPVPRVGDAYHESSPKSSIASATAIRQLIHSSKDYSSFMPLQCYEILESYLANNTPGNIELMYSHFLHVLATSPDSIKKVSDGNEELYNRMIKAVSASKSMYEYIDNVSTRRFTYARVSRAIMHSVLGISSDSVLQIRKNLPLYARVLGIKEEKRSALGTLTKQSKIPVVISAANPDLNSSLQIKMLQKDIAATNLYNMSIEKHFLFNQDYTQKLTVY